MHIVSIVLQILLGVAFVGAGVLKFTSKEQVEAFRRYGYTPVARPVTGFVEILGAAGMIVGLWHPALAMWSGLWLALTMIGALSTHLRLKDPAKVLYLPAALLIVALATSAINWTL